MSGYTRKEDAIDVLHILQNKMSASGVRALESAIGAIEDLVEADVVEVVRCKDCRWGKESCGNIECFADLNVPPEYHGYDWFCPNGEKR